MKISIRTTTSRYVLPTLAALVLFGSLDQSTRAQIPKAGRCYSVDTYPQVEKRAELAQFLTDARPLADKTAGQMADGRIEDLYAANQAGFYLGDTKLATGEAFKRMIAEMEEKEGKILEYEFRGLGLAVVGNPPRVDHIYSTAIYAVKTTKWKEGAYLDIRTIAMGNGQVVFHTWVEHFLPDSSDRDTFGKNMQEVCQQW